MELIPDYKHSEMGVIPEDWVIISVKQLVEEETLEKPLDGNHGNIHPKSSDYVDYGIPFVMANNFINGEVDLNNCKFITREQADSLQKGFSVTGDVLLTHKGTVGNTAIVGKLSNDYIMLTPQVTCYRVRNSKRLDNRFLRHYFDTPRFQSPFASLAGGGTRSYLGIVKQLELPIIKPPIREQLAIAEALSDVDSLLTTLDKIIIKKRHIKQAVIQQLLTGKIRLPGFGGEWVEKTLGSMCGHLTTGKLDANAMSPDGSYRFYTCAKDFYYINNYAFDCEALLISGNGAHVGYIHYYKGKFNAYQRTYVLSNFSAEIKYLQYYLSEKFSERVLLEVKAGGTPYITRNTIVDMLVKLPSSIDEQKAIAKILSDIDEELLKLEERHNKTKQLKQAMMQELLTGKTRLVKPEATHA
jgi:type I restriction enzyme S subunit